MVTAPLGPVYPVMVILPLLVVKVNWARPEAGSANNNTSGSTTLKRVFMGHSDFRGEGPLALSPYLPLYSFGGGKQEECPGTLLEDRGIGLKLRSFLQTNCSAMRLECVELAPAFEPPPPPDSASKLDALQTLREVRLQHYDVAALAAFV
jgi:hypothetical protein